MTIDISIPEAGPNLHPQITVVGVGGSGGNAVNNMMHSNLEGVDFLIANTDAQALQISNCKRKVQLGINSTKGLGAGMRPDIGREAAEEAIEGIGEKLNGSHMLFIAAGMGGGTGTGAAPVIAKLAREKGILTVGVVTKPFHFEGTQRMKIAEKGVEDLQQYVDTLLTIPNQNLFRIANEKTTFADAFKMADDVLYAGVRGVTDLMVQPGLINLDFSDVKTVMSEMGKAMMGTGEASGEDRAVAAAEAAIANPLIDDVSLKGARGLIINITGGNDITLYEVDEAANRIKQEVDESANIIYGTTCDERLEGLIRVSIVATGIDVSKTISPNALESKATISIDNSVYKQNTKEFNDKKIESINHLESDEVGIIEGVNNIGNTSNVINKENSTTLEEDNVFIEAKPDHSEVHTVEEESLENLEASENNDVSEENLNNNVNLEEENKEMLKQDEEDSQPMNEIDLNDSIEQKEDSEAQVRKLSLFDTLDKEIETEHSEDNSQDNAKHEPFLDKSNDLDESQDKFVEKSLESEFDPEEEISDENSKENPDDELLDIPTFLRRQAN